MERTGRFLARSLSPKVTSSPPALPALRTRQNGRWNGWTDLICLSGSRLKVACSFSHMPTSHKQGPADGTFPDFFTFISRIRPVKSPQKVFAEGSLCKFGAKKQTQKKKQRMLAQPRSLANASGFFNLNKKTKKSASWSLGIQCCWVNNVVVLPLHCASLFRSLCSDSCCPSSSPSSL